MKLVAVQNVYTISLSISNQHFKLHCLVKHNMCDDDTYILLCVFLQSIFLKPNLQKTIAVKKS